MLAKACSGVQVGSHTPTGCPLEWGQGDVRLVGESWR